MKLKVVCAVAVAAVVGEEQRLATALASASEKQRDARSNDTVGVIFLGLPVASLSGDNVAPDIARLKGESRAVSSAIQAKRCRPGAAPAAKPGA
jgi:hypothetical protein